MIPRLVFALDTNEINRAEYLARMAIQGGVDIIEIGTPLIKIAGLRTIGVLHKKYPTIPLYADLKVIDFPEMEIVDFFEANVSFVSVMAFANNYNVLKALELAESYNKKIFVSLMGYPESELKKRVKELSRLGVDHIIAHGSGKPEDAFDDLLRKIRLIYPFENFELVAAGGINELNIDSILCYHPKIIIIGRGISMQGDIKSATTRIKERVLRFQRNERVE